MNPKAIIRTALALSLGGALLVPYFASAAPDAPAPAPPNTPATGIAPAIPPKVDRPLTPVDIAAVHNALKWSDNIYSGSCPDGEAGYKALAEKGIKTIVTVDGATPDIADAHKYGLRYVHIPVEYSGIARVDALKIIRAVRDLPGPVFIHCHHGIHRGPAATALVAIALANYDTAKADAALKQAGTGLNYKGLWKDVDEFKLPTQAEIDAADNSFPETSEPSSLAAAMVHIDNRFDGLKTLKENVFKATAEHPDIDPAHEALLLREAFTELNRSEDTARRGADFAAKMQAAQDASQKLEDALTAGNVDAANTAFDATKATCGSCHKMYRDVKPN
ncbi:hypothetical protein IAD21_00379 [Abditibacteriota bacterium]|nr:hypothetical protein IAD21_00379 [Abditibacteriota bacterium]